MPILTWTEEKTEKLKDLWSVGLSCSQIALQLGNGFTRNSVVGKARRLNLAMRDPGKSVHTARQHVPVGMRSALKPKPVPVAPVEPIGPTLPPDVFAADGQCKWPYGETSEPGWRMCGRVVHKRGSPWCSDHHYLSIDHTKPKDPDKASRADASHTREMRRMGLG